MNSELTSPPAHRESGASPREEPLTSGTRIQTSALLLEKREVAPRHYEFRLRCPAVASGAQAGQFVHVLPTSRAEEEASGWSFDPFLRRAFSLMDIEGDEITLLLRVEGRGTATLAKAREGDWIDLIGPLGRGFFLEQTAPSLGQTAAFVTTILVAGGVGVPPMVLTARRLGERGADAQIIVGARSSGEVLCISRFEALGLVPRICTDDGSRGRQGRVDALLRDALEINPQSRVMACGPWPMLRAVALLCAEEGVACQVSLEENMPCGVGVCNGCTVPTIAFDGDASGDYGHYKRACVYGPVCDAREIAWT